MQYVLYHCTEAVYIIILARDIFSVVSPQTQHIAMSSREQSYIVRLESPLK